MKYKLPDETKTMPDGSVLYRAQCVEPFGDVKAGELGGWAESEGNLSQKGNACVYDNAWAHDNERVYDNERVRDDAWVRGNAWAFADMQVCGPAIKALTQ